jgi:hypothetical protein
LNWLKSMQTPHLIHSLERFPKTLFALIGTLADDAWRYKPGSGNWSILEIVCHLRDEEIEDFRARIRSTLDDPNRPWPKIDPVQAAVDRNYQQQAPAEVLGKFMQERATSLEWLRSLSSVDWNTAYKHPKIGDIPAGLLLGSWAAHDLLHLRQITKRLYELTRRTAAPYPIDYAGEWQET